MAGEIGTVHLSVRVTRIAQTIANASDIISSFFLADVPETMVGRKAALVDQLTRRLESQRKEVSNYVSAIAGNRVEEEVILARGERRIRSPQIATGLALAAGSAALFGAGTWAGKVFGTDSSHTVEMADRLDIYEENSKMIETEKKLFEAIRTADTEIEFEEAAIQASTYMEVISETCQKFFRGLEVLLTAQKLTPDLISFDKATEALDKLAEEVQKKGLYLPSEKASNLLFQLQSQFTANPEGDIKVTTKLPLLNPSQVLGLYRFSDLPIRVGESYLKVETKGQYIAVDGDLTRFAIISEKDIENCLKINSVFYCDRPAVLYRDFEQNCLGSIFKGLTNNIPEICEFLVSPPRFQISQISRNEFSLFAPKIERIRIYCPGRNMEQQTVEGATVLRLEKGCKATSSHFFLWVHSTDDIFQNATIFTQSLPESSLTKRIPLPSFGEIAKNLTKESSLHRVEDAYRHEETKGFLNQLKNLTLKALTIMAALTISILATSLLCRCMTCELFKRLMRLNKPSIQTHDTGGEQQEMVQLAPLT